MSRNHSIMSMSMAVAEAIVQRREVSWVAYSDGSPVARAASA